MPDRHVIWLPKSVHWQQSGWQSVRCVVWPTDSVGPLDHSLSIYITAHKHIRTAHNINWYFRIYKKLCYCQQTKRQHVHLKLLCLHLWNVYYMLNYSITYLKGHSGADWPIFFSRSIKSLIYNIFTYKVWTLNFYRKGSEIWSFILTLGNSKLCR